MKKLIELSKKEYTLLLKSGLFWELYPKATGIYEDDINETIDEELRINDWFHNID
jgi:hypothetical protein